MNKYLKILYNNIDKPIANPSIVTPSELVGIGVSIATELAEIYCTNNGFYAFCDALHFFSSGNFKSIQEVHHWNKPQTWKIKYENLNIRIWCFAENLFGEQFCVIDSKIFRFDPETCEFEYLASSIAEWCECILKDIEIQTGYPLAEDWLKAHGGIPKGARLVPKIPFVTGGEFEINNLAPQDALESMFFRANLYNNIKNVNDGDSIIFRITDE